MGLKETLEQNQTQTQNTEAKMDALTNTSAPVSEIKANNTTASQTALLSQEDVQNPNNWSQEPESQMQRFEFAASLAAQKKQSSFSLDNQSYDTRYVQEFIQTGRSLKPELLKNPVFLDYLQQSSKSGQTGKCYGKSFDNAFDCANVMLQISGKRQAYGTAINYSNIHFDRDDLNDTDEKIAKTYKDTAQELHDYATEPIEYKGKTYDLKLDMSDEKQWKYFNVLNEEIASGADLTTKSILRIAVHNDKLKGYSSKDDPLNYDASKGLGGNLVNTSDMQSDQLKILKRAHNLMEACGNPEIRPFEASNPLVQNIATGNNGLWNMPRSHFIPGITRDTLYLTEIGHFPAELAHAFRNKNNTFGEASQFARDGLKDILTFNSLGFTQSAQRKNYSDKDKMEYDTHKIVEPALKGYLDGKIPTIEQMYAQVDALRKKEGISYSQTDNAEEMTQKGYAQKAEKTSTQQMIVANAKAR